MSVSRSQGGSQPGKQESMQTTALGGNVCIADMMCVVKLCNASQQSVRQESRDGFVSIFMVMCAASV